jgi:hypothetical protein
MSKSSSRRVTHRTGELEAALMTPGEDARLERWGLRRSRPPGGARRQRRGGSGRGRGRGVRGLPPYRRGRREEVGATQRDGQRGCGGIPWSCPSKRGALKPSVSMVRLAEAPCRDKDQSSNVLLRSNCKGCRPSSPWPKRPYSWVPSQAAGMGGQRLVRPRPRHSVGSWHCVKRRAATGAVRGGH